MIRNKYLSWGTALGGVLVTTASLALITAPASANDTTAQSRVTTFVSPAQARTASAAVAAEDRRLTGIRSGAPRSKRDKIKLRSPYHLSGKVGDTLVLTPRSAPYLLADLLSLAPRKFVKMRDGSYLLSEHIAVLSGATLHLSARGGLNLRLASDTHGFATIVSLGGRLELMGEKDAHLTLSSWDFEAMAPDDHPYDGRAYVRAIGGKVVADYLDVSALGFWSGRTGGFALTGTDRSHGDVQNPSDSAASTKSDTSDPGTRDRQARLPQDPLSSAGSDRAGAPRVAYASPARNYVTSRISHTLITGNAYGLFISRTDGLSISDTRVTGSMNSGIVLHRFVTNGVLTRTSSSDNAGNGFTLDRATSGIKLNGATANDNAGSGFTVSGLPEAEGSSQAGASTTSYGNNSISNSTANGNAGYGIHIIGGFDIAVTKNRVSDTDMGIAVTGPAQRVSITGNKVTDAKRHGISLVAGVSSSTVTGNVVDRASTGVYVRDSTGQVKNNTVQSATTHGVAMVGHVGGSTVAYNTLAGAGSSALYSARSSGAVARGGNHIDAWEDDTPLWYSLLMKLLQPMTFMWMMIALVILISAVCSRRENKIAHPYAHQMAHQGHLPVPDPARMHRTPDPSRSTRRRSRS